MELTLTQELTQLRRTSRSFLDDRLGGLPATGPDPAFDRDWWGSALKLGWLSAAHRDGGPLEAGVISLELGRAAIPVPFPPVALALRILLATGADEVADALVREVEGGATVVTPLLGESVRAERHGGWTFRGGPVVVPWAAEATELLCVGATGSGEFAVSRIPATTAGVRIEPAASIDHEPVGVVQLDDVRPGDVVLTAAPDAVASAVAVSRLWHAAEMVGGTERALEMTVEHVNRRRQFDATLGSFQAVQHKLADMLTALDGATLATWEGLELVAADRDFTRAAAVAPYLAARAYQLAAVDSAQLHGGIGVTNEFPLHRYFQRAQGCRLRLGSTEEMLERISAAIG